MVGGAALLGKMEPAHPDRAASELQGIGEHHSGSPTPLDGQCKHAEIGTCPYAPRPLLDNRGPFLEKLGIRILWSISVRAQRQLPLEKTSHRNGGVRPILLKNSVCFIAWAALEKSTSQIGA